MPQATCKDCPKRHIGCHATCEDYIAFRKALDEENRKRHEKERIERMVDNDYHSIRSRRRRKSR